jgi:hypothetical protein
LNFNADHSKGHSPHDQGIKNLNNQISGIEPLGLSRLTTLAMSSCQKPVDSERCWFVTVLVECYPVSMLVDTGAGRTMIHDWILKKLLSINPSMVTFPSDVRLITASGDVMSTSKLIQVQIQGGVFITTSMVLVADLGDLQGVIGMDFLQQYSSSLEFSLGRISLGDEVLYLHRESHAEGFPVKLKNEIIIPTGMSRQVKGECPVQMADLVSVDVRLALVTLRQRGLFIEVEGVLDSLAVSDIEKICFNITNLSGDQMLMHKGEILAHAEMLDGSKLISRPCDSVMDDELFFMITVDSEDDDLDEDKLWIPPLVTTKRVTNGLYDHLTGMIPDDLNHKQKSSLTEILMKYAEVFMGPDGKLGKTSLVQHTIDTGNSSPVRQAARRLPISKKETVKTEIENMLKEGIVVPSNSPWASPIVLVTKKDGSTRFCIDYRQLNSITRKDAYPLPKIDECFDALAGSSWFCTLDLASGY